MADQKEQNPYPKKDVLMGQDVNVPYDMTTAGEEDTTVWDNMVQALKPDYGLNKSKQGQQ